MLAAALALSRRGLAVFPLVAKGKTPLAGSHGFKDATCNADTIREWWRTNPDYNIGVATGSISGGLLVLDVDDGCTGETSLGRLELAHELLPPSVTVITPGDDTKLPGRHVWLRLPNGVTLGSTVGRLGERLDTRADGGFCVAPPSVGPLGRRYQWSCDCAGTVATAPQWLLGLLAAPAGNGSTTPPADWLDIVTVEIPEGRRDATITRIAGHLLRRRIDPAVALELLHALNIVRCRPPLPGKDIARIISSVCGAELRRRGLDHGR
jgi:hypothetical protein